jgi:hypothetical protein
MRIEKKDEIEDKNVTAAHIFSKVHHVQGPSGYCPQMRRKPS